MPPRPAGVALAFQFVGRSIPFRKKDNQNVGHLHQNSLQWTGRINNQMLYSRKHHPQADSIRTRANPESKLLRTRLCSPVFGVVPFSCCCFVASRETRRRGTDFQYHSVHLIRKELIPCQFAKRSTGQTQGGRRGDRTRRSHPAGRPSCNGRWPCAFCRRLQATTIVPPTVAPLGHLNSCPAARLPRISQNHSVEDLDHNALARPRTACVSNPWPQ